jgi:hypothetical protein
VDAVDVTFDDVGSVSSRAGAVPLVSEVEGAALTAFSGSLIAAIAGNLEAINPRTAARSTLVSGIGRGAVAFAASPQWLYWSTSQRNGRISTTGASYPIAPEPPPVLSVETLESGQLASGSYRVAVSGIDASGVEGGIGYNGRVSLSLTTKGLVIQLAAGSTTGISPVVYLSAPDGTELYRHGVFQPGTTRIQIQAATATSPCDVEDRYPIPVAQCMAYRNGVLFVAEGNVVRYSLPFQPMLTHPMQFWLFDSRVKVLAPSDDGLFVGTEHEHWFVTIDETGNARRKHVLGYGAPLQNPARAASKAVTPIWATNEGIVEGLPGGEIREVTRDAVVFPRPGYAAVAYLSALGTRQYLASCF